MWNMRSVSRGVLAATVLTVSGTAILADTPATHSPQAVVSAFSRRIESHQALEGVKEYVAADFVEHDASVAGGDREGMIRYLTDHGWTQPSAVKSDIHIDRIIASGEFVVVHQHLRRAADQPVLVFVDIFRVHDGKIVEHWDVNQAVPQSPANTRYTMY